MALIYALLVQLLSMSLGGATIACVEELCILLALVLSLRAMDLSTLIYQGW
jgi:hypothetical protein